MAWHAKFNFRSTSGYVSDGAGQTYVIATSNVDSSTGEAYSVTRDTYTFGCTTNQADTTTRNRATAASDPRFAGLLTNLTANQCVWRLDLPASGSYDIRMACGDGDNGRTSTVSVYDNTTLLFTSTGTTTTSGFFLDTTGTQYIYTGWDAGNTKQTVSFATTTCIIKIGDNAGTLSGWLAHLDIEQLSSGPLSIDVNDNVGLSKLCILSETVTVDGNTCSVSIVSASALQIDKYDVTIPHDDGHGVAIQGSAGALILISAIDNVGLSKLISASEAITVTEPSPTVSLVNPSSAVFINLIEPPIIVTDERDVAIIDFVFVTELVSVSFGTLNVEPAPETITVTEERAWLVQGGTSPFTIQISKDDVVTVEAPDAIPGIPPMPNKFDVVTMSEPSPIVRVPLMPVKSEVVTVDDSQSFARLPFIVPSTADEVVVVSDVTDGLRFSRLFISVAEDVSAVEIAGIGRPSTTWEAGADSVSTWNGSGSTSDDWKPGAVEETVWA